MDNLNKIQSYIAGFKEIQNLSIAEQYFTHNEDIIIWKLLSKCNFNCLYCLPPIVNDEANFDISTIERSFNRDNKQWLIIITGGEPFMKKNFIDIVETITKKHYIHINTNLSTSNIKEFATRINPKNVWGLNVAAHVLERENHDKNFSNFVNNVHILQDKNFTLFISYVFYPDLINRVESDFKFFKENGMKDVTLRPYIGSCNNLSYPASYSPEELEFLRIYGDKNYELGAAVSGVSFKDNCCLAGKRTFYIDENGIARRCESLFKNGNSESYGNFFDDTFRIDKKEKVCTVEENICPFQCIFYAKKPQNNYFSFLKFLKFKTGK